MENKQSAALIISAAIVAIGMVMTAWVFQYGNAYNSCYRNAVATIYPKAPEENFFDQFDAPQEKWWLDDTLKSTVDAKRAYAFTCSARRSG